LNWHQQGCSQQGPIPPLSWAVRARWAQCSMAVKRGHPAAYFVPLITHQNVRCPPAEGSGREGACPRAPQGSGPPSVSPSWRPPCSRWLRLLWGALTLWHICLSLNASIGVPLCIHDTDAEHGRRACRTLSPNTMDRVLPHQAGNIDRSKPDPYGQCIRMCVRDGLLGTAGIEDGRQCFCSNHSGPIGIAGNQSDCNVTQEGLCSGNVFCGGKCRITEFQIVCPPTKAVPMSIGTVSLISIAVGALAYLTAGIAINRRRGEVGWDVVPNRDFWKAAVKLIGEGCIFSALCCIGKAKTAFNVGHAASTRYEQL